MPRPQRAHERALSGARRSGRLGGCPTPEILQRDDPDPADNIDKLLTALTTEHFVLQSVRGESAGRPPAGPHLSALSASLVALGSVIGRDVFGYFAGAVIPVLAALGLLTYVRLVEIGIEDTGHLAAIQRIRRFYAGLSPRGTSFFPDLADSPDRYGDNEVDSLRFMELTGGRWQMWFTAALVVGIINSMLVGAGVALALDALAHRPALAAAVGAAVAVALVLLHMGFQQVRYDAAWRLRQTDR
jgi:hypothetical protein